MQQERAELHWSFNSRWEKQRYARFELNCSIQASVFPTIYDKTCTLKKCWVVSTQHLGQIWTNPNVGLKMLLKKM